MYVLEHGGGVEVVLALRLKDVGVGLYMCECVYAYHVCMHIMYVCISCMYVCMPWKQKEEALLV